ncbi:MAG: uroporphyrinogen-III synthase [Planctomycetota bacterium]|jgi:uroporphyrinogen-III synthase
MTARRRPTLCLTGPSTRRAAARWVEAVEATGSWDVVHCPLIRVVGERIEPAGVTMLPAMVAVTSQNAIPALAKLWEERVDVREAPHAAVGLATARSLRGLGVDPVHVGRAEEAGAAPLAEAIVRATSIGDRVLWPRGDLASDLREHLVTAGRIVEDPLAYRSEEVRDAQVPDAPEAVFFASPSAVRAWVRRGDAPRPVALAIGATTQAELAPHYSRFQRLLRLPRPTPDALVEALATLRG